MRQEGISDREAQVINPDLRRGQGVIRALQPEHLHGGHARIVAAGRSAALRQEGFYPGKRGRRTRADTGGGESCGGIGEA